MQRNDALKPGVNAASRLQVVARAEHPSRLPLPQHREAILEAYLDGQSESAISENMRLPIEQVRETLRGYQQIAERHRRIVSMGLPVWLRDTHAEIAQQVWEEASEGFPPPANAQKPARRLAIVARGRAAA